jgi:hypothetical protein
MSDPISRLEFVCEQLNKQFGDGYAREHPEMVSAIMATAASDWAASRIAVAIEHVAVALLAEDEPVGIVRAPGLVR